MSLNKVKIAVTAGLAGLFLSSCGVEIVEQDSHATEVIIEEEPEIALRLIYQDAYGDRSFLTSDCLLTNDYGNSDAIVVSNHDEGHRLTLRWRQGISDLELQVLENGVRYYDGHFDYYRFERGGRSEVEIEIDHVSYILQLSGPRC